MKNLMLTALLALGLIFSISAQTVNTTDTLSMNSSSLTKLDKSKLNEASYNLIMAGTHFKQRNKIIFIGAAVTVGITLFIPITYIGVIPLAISGIAAIVSDYKGNNALIKAGRNLEQVL